MAPGGAPGRAIERRRRLPAGLSQSALAETLRDQFIEVFEREDITVEDDFFDLGGDSLIAESLMTAIERDLEVALTISSLVDASTPMNLAGVILAAWQKLPRSLVYPIHPAGEGPPLICIHGVRGNVVFTRLLAIALGQPRPVYAVRAKGLVEGETPQMLVGSIARSYLRETADLRGGGACVLVGHCAGGTIAYEMAQRLRRRGRPVSGLIMIDPPGPQRSGYRRLKRRGRIYWQLAAHGLAVRRGLDQDRGRNVQNSMRLAAGAYVPKPYAGETLLIHARETRDALLNPVNGWPALLPALQTAEVGPTHTSLFRERAGDIAAAMRAFLQSVSPL